MAPESQSSGSEVIHDLFSENKRDKAAGGEKIPGRFHISVPRTKERIWNLWSNAPKNKGRRSERLMQLIEKEVVENFDEYHE